MASIRFTAALLLFWGATAGLPAPAAERFVWFGASTGRQTKSEGISVARFDDDRGTLTPPVLACAVKNPSFLTLHPGLPVLYAVSEIAGDDGKPVGAVAAFAIDEATGGLEPMGVEPTGGAGPCHVSVDPRGTVVLAANYGGGSAICLGLAADGGLKPATTGTPGGFIQHSGARADAAGRDPRRQDNPHAHSVDVAPDGRFAFVCDLGLDKVFVHAIDRERATLAPHDAAQLKFGAGPRHFALHPDGRRAWCVNELDLTVTGFTYDPQAGALTTGETISTLPADVVDRRGFSTAEIAVHPNGKFLYASNRGHDSIAMFTIDPATSRLTFTGAEPIRGKTPRHFALDPAGKFLLAAGQGSDAVTVFAVDGDTGRLAFTGTNVTVPSPACVAFARQPLASSSSR